jgi:hypothetical protein
MIATTTGDTLANPSGKLPLSETLLADDGFSFDNRGRPEGTPFEAQVVDKVLDQTRKDNPLRLRDFPFRVELYTVLPAPGEAVGPRTRRVPEQPLPAVPGQPGLDPNALTVAARKGEIFEVRVTNGPDRRVGCAVLIDGLNTLGQRRERIENARLWVISPHMTNAIDGWHVDADVASTMTSKQFVFTDIADSVAGRQQFGDAIGTITVAFFDEKLRGKPRGLGVGEGAQKRVTVQQADFVPGRLLGAINLKYVEADAPQGRPAPR